MFPRQDVLRIKLFVCVLVCIASHGFRARVIHLSVCVVCARCPGLLVTTQRSCFSLFSASSLCATQQCLLFFYYREKGLAFFFFFHPCPAWSPIQFSYSYSRNDRAPPPIQNDTFVVYFEVSCKKTGKNICWPGLEHTTKVSFGILRTASRVTHWTTEAISVFTHEINVLHCYILRVTYRHMIVFMVGFGAMGEQKTNKKKSEVSVFSFLRRVAGCRRAMP